MRVVAGKWKSHVLIAPKGRDTRPTTDRVKESMFNLLPHQLSGVVVDLFAGSGALGLEALSRGAEQAVFVDKDRRALAAVRDNLRRLDANSDALVLIGDWRLAVSRIVADFPEVAWVLLDPPYAERLWEPVFAALADKMVITGGIVCEHPKSTPLPENMYGFTRVKHRVYGDIAVSIYAQTAISHVAGAHVPDVDCDDDIEQTEERRK